MREPLTNAGNGHAHLPDGHVLRLINDDESVIESSATYVPQRCEFQHSL